LNIRSRPETAGGLPWELHLFDAQQGAVLVDRVVNIGQVLQSRALSHSPVLVVHRAVANAHPPVVGSQVGNGNTAQMGADCRAHQHACVSGLGQQHLFSLVDDGIGRELVVLLVNLGSGQSSDENRGTVPDNLEHFSGREVGDVDFHVGVPVVPLPSVEPADDTDGVEPGEVHEGSVINGTESIDLGPSNFSLVLVVDSVFIEPVVDGGLEVDMVSEIAWSGRCYKELCFIWDAVGAIQLDVGSSIVLVDESEVLSLL
jgi:hypothetical protein